MWNALIIREIRDARKHGSGAKLCISIGKPEANLVCPLYLLYVSKKRGYIYVLKLVPTVSGNGQKSGNHERGCTSKHFRVPTLLSILQNAPLPKNTESGSSKQATQLSPRAALPALCFTSTYLSKYGSFSCKSMCIDIYRRQLRWSSLSVNWSVIRMQFFLQAQSSVRKPSD